MNRNIALLYHIPLLIVSSLYLQCLHKKQYDFQVLTTVLVVLAIHRIVEKDYGILIFNLFLQIDCLSEVNADVMLITAICGVAFNIVMGAVLHVGATGRHSHSHGGSSHRLLFFALDKLFIFVSLFHNLLIII